MLNFDFIADEGFRKSLENDYAEMNAALKNEMWKTVHIMAGSIVEALLVSSLQAKAYTPRKSGATVLQIMLEEAIEAARSLNIISERSQQLSIVVKNYRNLIHPGRVIRLEESIDSSTANVASALVEIIASEVEKNNISSYGFTAEQLVKKLSSDKTAVSIIPNLYEHLNESEKYTAVSKVIPDEIYYSLLEEDVNQDSIITLYSYILDNCSMEIRQKLGKHIESMIKTQDGSIVRSYLYNLFRFRHLEAIRQANRIWDEVCSGAECSLQRNESR